MSAGVELLRCRGSERHLRTASNCVTHQMLSLRIRTRTHQPHAKINTQHGTRSRLLPSTRLPVDLSIYYSLPAYKAEC